MCHGSDRPMMLLTPHFRARVRRWLAVPPSPALAFSSAAFLVLLGFAGSLAAAQTDAVDRSKSRRRAATAFPAEYPPQPAAVTMKGGALTIDANNSDLAQILRDMARESGMIVEGPVRDVRVFGKYGPQAPSAILTELLDGLGYNILMVGRTGNGAPERLVLSDRAGGPSPPAPVLKNPDVATNKGRDNTPEKIEEPQVEPAAVLRPPRPSDDPQSRVQQNMQKLQQMHDAQTGVQTQESAPNQ